MVKRKNSGSKKEENKRNENKSNSWEFHEECYGGNDFGHGMHGWHSHGMRGWHAERGDGPLGFIWPILSSLLGVFFLFILASAFDYFGYKATNALFTATARFLFDNLALLFGLMLVFGYAKWLTRRFEVLGILKPALKALQAVTALWVLSFLLSSTGVIFTHSFFSWLYGVITGNFLYWFLFFLAIAYAGFFIKTLMMQRWKNEGKKGYGYVYCEECGGTHDENVKERRSGEKNAKKSFKEEKWGGGRFKRLYLSNENKILGGVCGGIAEYFDVDPVIVRLIWVLAALAWGAGILAYLIAWIIIPRKQR